MLGPAGPGTRVEEITSSDELVSLQSIWAGVEAAGGVVNPFLSWDWQSSWWEVFAKGRDLRCLVVRSGEEVIGILPLFADQGEPGRLLPVGSGELSDHLGLLCVPGSGAQVAEAALRHLGRESTEVEFHYLVDGSESLTGLLEAARRLELAAKPEQEEVSPQVQLGSSFEDYLKDKLDKKDRHELRRKLHRLDSECPGWDDTTQAELGLDPALDAFFSLLRASRADKESFLTEEVEEFIRRACQRLQGLGWLRLQFLRAGDRLIAATLGFTVSGTWYLYNSGYDPELANLSPGVVAVALGIRSAIEEGCHTADFLRGNEGYKYHLGAVDRPLWRLRLALGPLGKDR